jgi:phosphoglycerate dehydrogenase-like enzyme
MGTILLALEPDSLSAEQLAQIRALSGDSRLLVTDQQAEMEGVLDDIEVIAGPVSPELALRAPHLRWFQQWGAGADWLLRHPEAASRPFILTNVSGIHAIPISEHILAMMLAFVRSLSASIRAQERHHWLDWDEKHTFELAGGTLLVIGVGAIGGRTAKLASALGMRVLGVRHNPAETVPEIERMGGPEDLPSLLPQADFVVLTVPLTRETRNMIGERELGLMRPGSYIIINIGRGGTIDETALIEALKAKRVAGAGLDVFEAEPLPADSPFWGLPNVIITAHYAGSTPFYTRRALEIFIENLRRYRAGQPLEHVVDKERGY